MELLLSMPPLPAAAAAAPQRRRRLLLAMAAAAAALIPCPPRQRLEELWTLLHIYRLHQAAESSCGRTCRAVSSRHHCRHLPLYGPSGSSGSKFDCCKAANGALGGRLNTSWPAGCSHWCHYHGVDSGGRAAAAGLRAELTLPPAGAAADTAPNPAPPLPPLSACRSPCSCAWLTASCLHWSSPRCCK